MAERLRARVMKLFWPMWRRTPANAEAKYSETGGAVLAIPTDVAQARDVAGSPKSLGPRRLSICYAIARAFAHECHHLGKTTIEEWGWVIGCQSLTARFMACGSLSPVCWSKIRSVTSCFTASVAGAHFSTGPGLGLQGDQTYSRDPFRDALPPDWPSEGESECIGASVRGVVSHTDHGVRMNRPSTFQRQSPRSDISAGGSRSASGFEAHHWTSRRCGLPGRSEEPVLHHSPIEEQRHSHTQIEHTPEYINLWSR